MDMHIEYADGTEQVVQSDGTWKVSADGPTRYDDYYLGETYDARKEIANWNKPGFDASKWPAAQVVDAPKGQMRAQRGDPTKLVATWPAGKRSNPKPGVSVWDTGQQRSGWATIHVYGAPAGTPIQIAYSDKTAEDGTIGAGPGEMQVDYYIAKGTGTAQTPEVFTPEFTYKGHQYIQVSSPTKLTSPSGGGGGFGGGASVPPEPLPNGVTVNVAAVHEVRTAMPASSTFSASNPLLARIEKNMRAALAENYVSGIITDTPQYEKNGWTGDAQLSVPAVALQFDAERQFWKSFQDMADAQEPSGELTLLAPTAKGYSHVGQVFKPAASGGASPIWEAFWFVTPWESYLRYGDARALEATYPLMQKYLDGWVPQWTDKDGDNYKYTLTAGLGDWAPVTGADAPAGSPTNFRVPTIISPSVTAYYAYLTQIAADTARALGKTDDARRYDLLFDNIRTDFNAKWWDEKAGFYRENQAQVFVQGMAALPLAFGLVPNDKRGHRRHALDSAGAQPGRRRGRAGSGRRRLRHHGPDHVSELRLLDFAGVDGARRVLGEIQPDAQPPHVRHRRAVALREPGRHPAHGTGVQADRVPAHGSNGARSCGGYLRQRARQDRIVMDEERIDAHSGGDRAAERQWRGVRSGVGPQRRQGERYRERDVRRQAGQPVGVQRRFGQLPVHGGKPLVLQQLRFFSAWKDRCGTGRHCAPASLTQSRKDAKEYLEVFASWRLGVRQSVGFGCGSAAEWGRPSAFVACLPRPNADDKRRSSAPHAAGRRNRGPGSGV
jgi:hypothetical protein